LFLPLFLPLAKLWKKKTKGRNNPEGAKKKEGGFFKKKKEKQGTTL
jgi:hypothetical protein